MVWFESRLRSLVEFNQLIPTDSVYAAVAFYKPAASYKYHINITYWEVRGAVSPGATEEILIEKWSAAAQAILDQVCVCLKPGKRKLSGTFIPMGDRAVGGGAGLGPLSEGK